MTENTAKNYFLPPGQQPAGIRYRLEGDDIIQSVIDTLKGGLKEKKGNSRIYYSERELMNNLGVERVRLFLQSAVSKVSHLSKYEGQERINAQMRALMKAFIFELVLNLKVWAPEASFKDGNLINPYCDKVKNKRLVVQVVENALYASMLRGSDGFEAELLSKSWMVQEQPDAAKIYGRGGGLFGRIFGRGREGDL